jgi:hypothetical protein
VLVYDEGARAVLLTGGSTPLPGGNDFRFFDDVWSFDGTRWRARPSAGVEMSGQRLVYDTRDRSILSVGGYTRQGSVAHTRRLKDGVWTDLPPVPDRPTAEGGLAFDVRRGRTVLFGGAGPRTMHGDTWEFDGARWTRVATQGPPARQAFAMAYDSRRHRTIVFGGSGGTPQARYGDTWEYDGTRWQRVASDSAGPGPRMAPGGAYDAARGLFVIFGGINDGGFLGDTWGWDGTAWRKLAETGPEPRAMGMLAYDSARERIVLFGGRKGWPDGDLDDTWEWDGRAWRRVGRVSR